MSHNNIWEGAPAKTFEVEPLWNSFIEHAGGMRVNEFLSKSPSLKNADYIFPDKEIIIELKEIKTQFTDQPGNQSAIDALSKKTIDRLLEVLGEKQEAGQTPELILNQWRQQYLRIFRPNLVNICKKANKQLKQTKAYFDINSSLGVIVIVNEEFTGLTPQNIISLLGNILENSYSSIDCCLYVSVNRYVEILDSDEPKLVWAPIYSDRAPDLLVEFINWLGEMWFDFLEDQAGPFTSRATTDDMSFLSGARSITIPET